MSKPAMDMDVGRFCPICGMSDSACKAARTKHAVADERATRLRVIAHATSAELVEELHSRISGDPPTDNATING
jgi:hypothetical protein